MLAQSCPPIDKVAAQKIAGQPFACSNERSSDAGAVTAELSDDLILALAEIVIDEDKTP